MSKFVIPASATSWIEVSPESHFPIQNLPLGCGYGESETGEIISAPLSAIGGYAIHLWALADAGLMKSVEPGDPTPWTGGVEAIRNIRRELFEIFQANNPILRDDPELQKEVLIPLDEVELGIPLQVTAFVDFYSGIHHASNVGRMFRPDQPPLLPNYKHLPIGYNGRASTVIPTDIEVIRPDGVQKIGDDVVFGPTKELDFELELGYFIVKDTQMGDCLTVDETENAIGGLVLVNDWSARDVQRFEYQPLGPFLAKSFATSVSPWIVSLDALDEFRIPGISQDPAPLPHLQGTTKGQFDIHLEVSIQSQRMTKPQVICQSNTKNLYWSIFQQLAHQTSNGTSLEVGDLYATGTISGETEDSFGSMLELTWRGQKPITLNETGETRTFLEDGDTVTMTAYAQGNGYRIGFGNVIGHVVSK